MDLPIACEQPAGGIADQERPSNGTEPPRAVLYCWAALDISPAGGRKAALPAPESPRESSVPRPGRPQRENLCAASGV